MKMEKQTYMNENGILFTSYIENNLWITVIEYSEFIIKYPNHFDYIPNVKYITNEELIEKIGTISPIMIHYDPSNNHNEIVGKLIEEEKLKNYKTKPEEYCTEQELKEWLDKDLEMEEPIIAPIKKKSGRPPKKSRY